ncbi:MAG: glycine oxidase [Chloroflexota bacterium]|jgi:glycine oxidase|nr:glycine oxidase [Chloroflexota bacterium]
MIDRIPDVLVVGGGLIGCSIAYALACEGAKVTVVERAGIGAEASSAAAGILAPRAHATEGALFPFAMASHARYPAWIAAIREETPLDVEYIRSGVLHVAITDAEGRLLRERADRLRADGHDVTWLEPFDVLSHEPALNARIRGGMFDVDAYHVNPSRLTQAVAQAAARHGVHFVLGGEVQGIGGSAGRATAVRTATGAISGDHIVLATGAWMATAGDWLGMAIPIAPARGQILALSAMPSPIQTIIWGEAAYLLPRFDGSIVLGATVEHVGFDRRLTASGINWLLEQIPALCPVLRNATFLRAWTGFRPMAPDELPIIGRAPGWDNVTIATGHHRNGITLAPITAELVARLVLHEESDQLIEPFRPARFLPPT